MQPIDIKSVISRLALPAAGAAPQTVERHLQEVLRWNPRIGLVSKLDTLAVLERLTRQSLHLLELVEPQTSRMGEPLRVVDVGSGGGFPGLVWAAVRPGVRLLLVERREKKATFLERMVKVLDFYDAEVFAGAAQEALAVERFTGSFDVATTMAVGPPAKTAALVEGFLRAGGIFATTVPRDQPRIPSNVGAGLSLLETDADEETLYALYQKC